MAKEEGKKIELILESEDRNWEEKFLAAESDNWTMIELFGLDTSKIFKGGKN